MRPSLETRALCSALLMAFLCLGWTRLLAGYIQKESASAQVLTPVSAADEAATPEMVKQGGEYFGLSCSQCHGDDAHGDEGPDLHNLAISNARIANTIRKGVKGEMPTFAKKYDDQQIAALVSYLRTLK